MKKKKTKISLILVAVLFFVYLYLFPYPLGKELQLRPVWAIEISTYPFEESSQLPPAAGSALHGPSGTSASMPPAAASALHGPSGTSASMPPDQYYWFRAGEQFGYFNLQGRLLYLGEAIYDVALSKTGFINFGKISENIVFKDIMGNFRYSIKGYGYPVLDREGERLFTINTDLCGIKELSREGEILWSNEFTSPVTSISLSGVTLLVGLLTGTTRLINQRGEIEDERIFSESRIPVILGTAINETGEQIAVISGIDPQKLSVLQKKERALDPVFTVDLDSDFRREIMAQYSEDGKFLFFEGSGGLGVLDVRGKRKMALVELAGPILGISSSGRNGTAAVSAESGKGPYLVIFRPNHSIIYRGSFLSRDPSTGDVPTRDIFLKQADNHLFAAVPGYLFRFDLLEE